MMSHRVLVSPLKLFTLVVALVVCWIGSAAPTRAQESLPEATAALPVFNLEQCVDIALQSSLSLAISREQKDQAAQDIKAAYELIKSHR